jgi:hypothetical protein
MPCKPLEEGKAPVKARITILALAASVTLSAAPVAAAAPVTVDLRVEGASATIFEGPVNTDGHPVDGGDGTGAHPCDGTNGAVNPSPGATVTSALADAAVPNGWHGTWDGGFEDFLIDGIGGETGTSFTSYWGSVLNFQPTSHGGCQEQVDQGDQVLFALGDVYSQPLLRLSGPARAPLDVPVSFSVTDGKTGTPAANATVAGLGSAAASAADGSATIAFAAPGLVTLKASRADAIRSNALTVCVSVTGTGDCGAQSGELGGPAPSSVAHDSKAPIARISGPRDGARYVRGPRLLRGTAADEVGVTEVKLALRRHVRGSCRWWSGRRERFVGSNCHKKFFFAIGDKASWSYLLPRRLGPGRYVLDVKALDEKGNRAERFVRGANRIVFHVSERRSGHAGASAASRSRHPAAKVTVMVVGRDGVLLGPRVVRLRAARIRVAGKRCALPAATPLSALAAALAPSSVDFHVRDFGSCSKHGRDSAQLFVDRIADERNTGSDGWVYKVGRRAGSAGAADPGGPFGHGRLQGGRRLLWFYCRLDSGNGRCQRTLVVRALRGGGAPGERLSVTVRGYDDDGRGRREEGVSLTLGGSASVTGADGRAALTLPASGRYLLEASKPGLVPAFPVAVRVEAR